MQIAALSTPFRYQEREHEHLQKHLLADGAADCWVGLCAACNRWIEAGNHRCTLPLTRKYLPTTAESMPDEYSRLRELM